MNVNNGGGIDFAKLLATNPAAAAAIAEFNKKEEKKVELFKDLVARFPGSVVSALMDDLVKTLLGASPNKLDEAFEACCRLCENQMKKESVTHETLKRVESSLGQLG